MKVIVAGSRVINDEYLIYDKLNLLRTSITFDEVVSGCATGPDTIGARWAREQDLFVREFLPDWREYGRSAGIVRNEQMGDYADCLVAFWDGRSNGTKHMIDYMLKLGKEVHVYGYKTT